MKNKGISLIVLIITIIVVIILAGAVIVSMVNNNVISQASEAKYKQDLKSLNERAQTSLLKESVHDSSVLKKTITDKEQIYLYIPELKGTAYEDKVYIANGEIILKGAMLTKEEIKWAKEIHIKIDNLPVIDSLVLTSTETEVTASITVVENPDITGYRYRILGVGASEEWVDKVENSHVFTSLKPGEEYIVEAVACTEQAESIITRGVVSTQGISEQTKIVISPTQWTANAVTVTITHGNRPSGYVVQYKIESGEWQDYTAPFLQNENASIKARLYNKILADEIAVSSSNITNIDKTVPTLPTAINVISTGYNSITVQAEGSTDVGSGMVGYEYSTDGTTYSAVTTENHVISNVKAGATVTVYARAKDGVGLVSTVKQMTTTTTGVSEQVSIVATPTTWINGSVTVTLSHSNIPSGYVMQYKLGDGNWVDYSSAFSQGENTSITARLYHVSLADEIAVSSSNITNIDKTVPTIATAINVISTGYNSITVQAEGSTDVGSGVVGYEYSTDGTNYSAVTTENYVINNIKAGASVTVYARAKDGVGLVSAVKQMTTTTTGVSEQVSIVPNTTAWTNTVLITLSHSAIPSGYVMQYKQDAGAWTNYSTPFTITSNTNITARLYLSSINDEIAVKSSDITNIDTTAPTKPTINLNGYASGSWTNQNVVQTFNSTDGQSGVSYYQYSHDGVNSWTTIASPWVINFDGQWNFYIRAVDVAGNISVSSDVYTIRRDSVGPTVTNVTTSVTHNSVTANAVASDGGIGVAGYQYYCTSNNIWGATEGASKTFSGLASSTTYHVYVRAVDSLGNIGPQVGPYVVATGAPPTIEASLKPGDYVAYTGGGYTSWRVLYDNAHYGRTEIISSDNVTNVMLQGLRGFYTCVDYNNLVAALNSTSANYLNTAYGTRARSVGSDPNNPAGTTERFIPTYSYLSPYDFIKPDTNYLTDYNAMVAAGLQTTSRPYWLASRYITHAEPGTHLGGYSVTDTGTILEHDWIWLLNYANGQNVNTATVRQNTYGVRPVILLKPGLMITGGNGTQASPYTLQ